MWKDSVAGWVKNGLTNCYILHKKLLNARYKIDKYNMFSIHEPKKRDIVSTRFKDRVFQRSLCDNYLTEVMTKSFIWDNAACQKGKGTHHARARLVCHLQRFYRKYGLDGYVLQMDLHNFFGSTPHSVAKEVVAKRVPDPWARQMVFDIIDSFNQGENPEIGMGLGSQVTQLVQLAVLDDIDHFIKENLGIRAYVRYNDDLILVHHSKEHIQFCKREIDNKIKEKGLELNPKKTQIFPVKQPIHFLGFSFRLTESGKVVQKILPEKISHERRKLKKLVELSKSGKMTKEHVDECFKSWMAHASEGNCDGLIQNMIDYYNKLWEEDVNGL